MCTLCTNVHRFDDLMRSPVEVMKNTQFDCPKCSYTITVEDASITIAECEGATLDCNKCNALLLVKGGKAVSFHEEMNKETDGRWPVDGANTHYIEV